jgi:hypothetical protein
MKTLLQKIPKQKLLILIVFCGLLPFMFSLLNFNLKKNSLDELNSSLEETKHLAYIREKKQAINMALRNHNKDADHFYIDKHLETLTFLEPEIDHLHKLVNNPNFAEDEVVKKRLEFLTGPANSMIFSEGVVQSHPLFQETTETLVHPVEVNNSNIQQILSHVEGIEIGAFSPPSHNPQLIILDFKLDKKSLNEKNDVFLLNMKLLKREFL